MDDRKNIASWEVEEISGLLACQTRKRGALSVRQKVGITHSLSQCCTKVECTVCEKNCCSNRLFPWMVTWPQDPEQETANLIRKARLPRVIGVDMMAH